MASCSSFEEMIHFNCHLQTDPVLTPTSSLCLSFKCMVMKIQLCRGGVLADRKYVSTEGVSPNSTNMYKGRVGVKNPRFFAYVLYGCSLTVKLRA